MQISGCAHQLLHAGTLVRGQEAPIATRCSDPLRKAQSFGVLLLSRDACAVLSAESCPSPLCDFNFHHICSPNKEGKQTASCFPLSSGVSPGYFARVLFNPALVSARSDENKQRSHGRSGVSASGPGVVTQQQQLRWWGLRCDLVLQNHSTAPVMSFGLLSCSLFSRACNKGRATEVKRICFFCVWDFKVFFFFNKLLQISC